MDNTQKYIDQQMKDPEFLKAFNEEKAKLDIEFMLDDLAEKIKMERSYNDLLKGVNKIKRKLVKV